MTIQNHGDVVYVQDSGGMFVAIQIRSPRNTDDDLAKLVMDELVKDDSYSDCIATSLNVVQPVRSRVSSSSDIINPLEGERYLIGSQIHVYHGSHFFPTGFINPRLAMIPFSQGSYVPIEIL